MQYKDWMKSKGLSMDYVADKMGISRQTLWAKMNGKSEFSRAERRLFFDIVGYPYHIEIDNPRGECLKELDKNGYNVKVLNLIQNGGSEDMVKELTDANWAILGESGSGKSSNFILPNLLMGFLENDDDSNNKNEKDSNERIVADNVLRHVIGGFGREFGKVIANVTSKYGLNVESYLKGVVDAVYKGIEEKYPEVVEEYAKEKRANGPDISIFGLPFFADTLRRVDVLDRTE